MTMFSAKWQSAIFAAVLVPVLAAFAPAPALAQSAAAPVAQSQAAVGAAMKDLPGWKIPDICARDSAATHCMTLEGQAFRAVSGSWVSLPDAVKGKCLGDARLATDQSWRVLGDCIDEEMERNTDRRAVKTRNTPGEPVPPPKPAVVAVEVPPPLLGVPMAPPPFAVATEEELRRQAAADAATVKAAADAATAAAAAKAATDAATAKAAADAEARRKADADAAAAKAAADAATAAAAAKAATDAATAKAAADAEARRKADADAAAAKANAAKAATDAATARAAAEVEARRKAEADAVAAKLVAEAKSCENRMQEAAKAGVIRFAFGKTELDAASRPTLEKIATVAKECPNNRIRVEGHTDAIGDSGSNEWLSQQRAQKVLDLLVQAGLDASRIDAKGFGAEKPVADNATPEGRAQNRRIQFTVTPR